MTMPTVEATATFENSTQATSHDVTLPSTIEAGNLLVMIARLNTGTVGAPPGWSVLGDDGLLGATSTGSQAVFTKIATGSEGATANVSASGAAGCVAITYEISGWSDVVALVADATEDPPNLAPWFGAQDTLWIANMASLRTNDWSVSAAPTNYSNLLEAANPSVSASSVGMVSAERTLNAASENPGTFTISGTLDSEDALTIGIASVVPSGPPVWGEDLDDTTSGAGPASFAVTFAETPSDDELIVLTWVCGDETEAEPVWPSGFVSYENTNKQKAQGGWVAWKVAASEGSATYAITPDGGGNFPAFQSTLAGCIVENVNTSDPVGEAFRIMDPDGNTGAQYSGSVDVGYTDTMTLAFILSNTATPSKAEFDPYYTRQQSNDVVFGRRIQTTELVVRSNKLQEGSTGSIVGVLIIRGSGSVVSTGYLGDQVGQDELNILFEESGYTDGSPLTNHSDWTAEQVSGSGVPEIDEHKAHQLGQVADMGNLGHTYTVNSNALSDVNQWAGLTVFVDIDSTGSAGSWNRFGQLLRLQAGTAASTMDGYAVVLERDMQSGATTYLRIYLITDAGEEQLATSADLEADFGGSRLWPARVHARIDGDDISGYVDGVSVVTHTISGADTTEYDAGDYSGIVHERGRSHGDSQPFVDDFIAGVLASGTGPQTWTGTTAAVNVTAVSAGLIPLDLRLISKTDTSITMEWNGVWGAVSYDLERDGSVVQTGITDTQVVDSPLVPDTEYDHRVRAVFQ